MFSLEILDTSIIELTQLILQPKSRFLPRNRYSQRISLGIWIRILTITDAVSAKRISAQLQDDSCDMEDALEAANAAPRAWIGFLKMAIRKKFSVCKILKIDFSENTF